MKTGKTLPLLFVDYGQSSKERYAQNSCGNVVVLYTIFPNVTSSCNLPFEFLRKSTNLPFFFP
jgi:hypothetical protein